jgi:hypothetical protein
MLTDPQLNNLIAFMAFAVGVFTLIINIHQSYKFQHYKSSCCGDEICSIDNSQP